MDKKTIRLILCDIDGTLLNKENELPPGFERLLGELKQKGVLFTVATGRSEPYAASVVKELSLALPYIVTNGAAVVKGEFVQNGATEVLWKKRIRLQPLKEIVGLAYEMDMTVVFTIDGYPRIERLTDWLARDQKKFGIPYREKAFSQEEWETLAADKVMLLDDARDGRIRAIEELCAALPAGYAYTRYTDKAVEVVEGSADKANALRFLSEYLSVPLEQVLAIGDHQNDIAMLKTAGAGAAVANATAQAKEAADYVCENTYGLGVMEAIRRYL